MQDQSSISHTGKVASISKNTYSIMLEKPTKCEGCAAAALCRTSGSTDILEIGKSCSREQLAIGDKVKINISSSLTWIAILYSLFLPLLLLAVVTIATHLLSGSNIAACISGLSGVALYYWIAYKLKIGKHEKLYFKIHRLTN